MAKFYVEDVNKHQVVFDRPTKLDAAKAFVCFYKGRGTMLGPYIVVSELGFNPPTISTDSVFNTQDIMVGVAG